EEPALALGSRVDQRRVVLDRGIALGDRAADRRVDVARGLDRFDHRRLLAFGEYGTRLGDLDEDDVAELRLCVVGDADGGGVAVDLDPFVLLGEIARHRRSPWRW